MKEKKHGKTRSSMPQSPRKNAQRTPRTIDNSQLAGNSKSRVPSVVSSSHFSCSTLPATPTSFEVGRGPINHQGRNVPAGISLVLPLASSRHLQALLIGGSGIDHARSREDEKIEAEITCASHTTFDIAKERIQLEGGQTHDSSAWTLGINIPKV
jgi:hypothetical protein